MSLQPRRPILEALRDTLRKLEAYAGPETPTQADLKRIIRDRISALEETQETVIEIEKQKSKGD